MVSTPSHPGGNQGVDPSQPWQSPQHHGNHNTGNNNNNSTVFWFLLNHESANYFKKLTAEEHINCIFLK